MATKKKTGKKKVARRIDRVAPWSKDQFAPGTVTVTMSLVYIQRTLDNVLKGLKNPEVLLRLREVLDQILSEKLSKKSKGKKKPARDPNLN